MGRQSHSCIHLERGTHALSSGWEMHRPRAQFKALELNEWLSSCLVVPTEWYDGVEQQEQALRPSFSRYRLLMMAFDGGLIGTK